MKTCDYFLRAALTLMTAAGLLVGVGQMQAQFGPPKKHTSKGPWENQTLSPDQRADLVVAQMTLDEKLQLLHVMGWVSLFTPLCIL